MSCQSCINALSGTETLAAPAPTISYGPYIAAALLGFLGYKFLPSQRALATVGGALLGYYGWKQVSPAVGTASAGGKTDIPAVPPPAEPPLTPPVPRPPEPADPTHGCPVHQTWSETEQRCFSKMGS